MATSGRRPAAPSPIGAFIAARLGGTKSQAGLAAALGVRPPTVSKWLHRGRSPSREFLPAIAKYLGCTEEELERAGVAPAAGDPGDYMRAAVEEAVRRSPELEQSIRAAAPAGGEHFQRLVAELRRRGVEYRVLHELKPGEKYHRTTQTSAGLIFGSFDERAHLLSAEVSPADAEVLRHGSKWKS